MRRRSIAGTLSIALAVAGCGFLGPATETARLSPPPLVDEAAPWPALTFGGTLLGRPDGVLNRRLVAVAHGPPGFVAVGSDDRGDVVDGSAWHAPDGVDWKPAANPEVFAGVDLVDVAAGGPGFVAIGTRGGDPWLGATSRVVVFTSPDGRAWTALPDGAGEGEWYADGIVAGSGGLIAWGAFHPDETFAWFSVDGVAWDRKLLPDLGLADAAWIEVIPDGDGWLAGGSVGTRTPAVFSSRDGLVWETQELATTRAGHEGYVDRLVVGRWGRVATGGDAAPCGPMSSCPGATARWWSRDGAAWGLMPDLGLEGPGAFDPIAPAGERGLLSVSDLRVYASPDGWSWTWLTDAAMDGSVNDVVVAGDLVVAVGEWTEPDGGTAGTIQVGGPGVEVLD